jgi:hypothetical protein
MKNIILALSLTLSAAASPLRAQSAAADGPILRARRLYATAPAKMYVPSGTVRLVGWDRDSLVVRGRIAASDQLVLSGSDSGVKLTVEPRTGDTAKPSNLVIYLPRRSQVSVKAVDANVSAADLSGWYYTVSGRIELHGSVSSADVESMTGNIDLNVAAPWVRAKTGPGSLLVRGAPQDVDASTIGGTLDVASSAILRGRFASVTGDIRYTAIPAPRSLFEFSDQSGVVDLLLPRDASARLELSSVTGEIANGFTQVQPAAAGPHSLRIRLGSGDAQLTVRTFRGMVRVRPRQ